MQRVSININYDISSYVLPLELGQEELNPVISFTGIMKSIFIAQAFSVDLKGKEVLIT